MKHTIYQFTALKTAALSASLRESNSSLTVELPQLVNVRREIQKNILFANFIAIILQNSMDYKQVKSNKSTLKTALYCFSSKLWL